MDIHTIMSVMLGVGLAAACGFRVFLPLAALSWAAQSGLISLAPSFAWIGTAPALWTFSVATVLEVAGYYVPWVDHLLDSLATPAAIVAGTMAMAAVLTDMSPFMQWTLAMIAGGGAAGIVQGGTVMTRLASTSATAGFANPLLASVEFASSGLLSLLALFLPWLGFLLVVAVCVWIWIRARRRILQGKSSSPIA